MDKFSYEEEMQITDSQCSGCIYEDKDDPGKCGKYEQKPEDIVTNKYACAYYDWEGSINLD